VHRITLLEFEVVDKGKDRRVQTQCILFHEFTEIAPKLPGIKAIQISAHLDNQGQNNFKLIRLISALGVIWSHCYRDKDPVWILTGHLFVASAVAMQTFFFLSGLLVAQSLDRSPSRRNFVWKRILRIYPAAVVGILATALILGPLLTTLPLNAYFTDPLFFRYLRSVLLIQIHTLLPGVFMDSPLGNVVNASLWSLSVEWKCYAGLLLASFIPRKTRSLAIMLLALALLVADAAFYTRIQSTGLSMLGSAFTFAPYSRLVPFFLAGNLVYYHRRHIRVYPWWPLPILLFAALFAPLGALAFFYASCLLLPALILYLGFTAIPFVQRLTPRPDLSYGIFVWAFPVEQLIVNYLHPGNPTLLFTLTILLTLPLALLSWYCIELPAIKQKKAIS